jgi:DNA-binding protein H-NS
MHAQLQAALRPDPATPSVEWTLADIERELAQLRIQRQRLEARERVLLRALGEVGSQRISEVDQGLQAMGDSLQDVLQRTLQTSARKPRQDLSKLANAFVRKAPLKFRHPERPALVWSGRGKRPEWIQALEREGRLEEARILPASDSVHGQTS